MAGSNTTASTSAAPTSSRATPAPDATAPSPTSPGAAPDSTSAVTTANTASGVPSSTASSTGTGRGSSEERLERSSGSATTAQSLMDGLRCDLLMNARYHASREAFLDSIHRVLMFLIIILGAAAITDLFGGAAGGIKGYFAACAVVFAAIDLTCDLSNRARCHALMKRRYFELLADLVSGRKTLVDVEEHMHRCSADEEPAFHALLALSWNAAQEMVYGTHADSYKIPWPHKALKNYLRFGRKYEIIGGSRTAPA